MLYLQQCDFLVLFLEHPPCVDDFPMKIAMFDSHKVTPDNFSLWLGQNICEKTWGPPLVEPQFGVSNLTYLTFLLI